MSAPPWNSGDHRGEVWEEVGKRDAVYMLVKLTKHRNYEGLNLMTGETRIFWTTNWDDSNKGPWWRRLA